jgi:glycogen debranching enzyme
LFEASLTSEFRLPELFCGFDRRDGAGPVPYPTACSPQAWSAGAVFLLIGAVLGMTIDAGTSRLSFLQPTLPRFLDEIRIANLAVGEGNVDLLITRRDPYAKVEIERRKGRVELFTAA